MVVPIPTEPTEEQLEARIAATTPNVVKAPGIYGAAAVTAQPNNGQKTLSAGVATPDNPPTSPFSSSAMPIITKTAAAATNNATTALNAPQQPAPPPNGIVQNKDGTYSVQYNGQTIGSYKTQQAAANAADVLAGTGTPNATDTTTTPTTTTPTITAPTGYTAGTPDQKGNIVFSNTQTGQSFTVPAGTANPGQVAANAATVQNQILASGLTGYGVSITPSGSVQMTDATGQPVGSPLSSVAASDPTGTSQANAVGAIATYNSAKANASATAAAATASENASYAEQLQQLKQEEDAAIGAEPAGAAAIAGRYATLIGELGAAHQANLATISAQQTDSVNTAASTMNDSISKVNDNALSTQQYNQGVAIKQATTTDYAGAQFTQADGTTMTGIASAKLDANGSTGNAAVDNAIANLVSTGAASSPQSALAQLQLGTYTQNKTYQGMAASMLANNAALWSGQTLEQVKSGPYASDFNTVSGILQSAYGVDKTTADQMALGGTLASQKVGISEGVFPGGAATPEAAVQSFVTGIQNGTITSIASVPAAYKTQVAEAMAAQGVESPLADSRYTMAVNRIVANYIALPGYQLTANGLPYLERIAAAMQTPGSVSDQDLLDSLTKLNTAGNAISDAQVQLITGGKSLSDWASVLTNKLGTGGVLSDDQRQQISQLSQQIYKNYAQGYQPIYDQATKQLTQAGIPQDYWTIPDLNSLNSAQVASFNSDSSTSFPNGPTTDAGGGTGSDVTGWGWSPQ